MENNLKILCGTHPKYRVRADLFKVQKNVNFDFSRPCGEMNMVPTA